MGGGHIDRIENILDTDRHPVQRAAALPGLALGSFGYTQHFAHYYTPMTVSVGVALEPIEPLSVSLDVTWSQWSEYLDSDHDNHDGALFSDTVTPRVGASWKFVPSTALLAGYYYEPSPFDNRSAGTNFVDNDKHVVSIGTQTDLRAFGDGNRPPLRLCWHAQLQVLRERREVKDWTRFSSEEVALANPGWPGWLSGGWVLNIGLSLDAVF